MNPVLSCEPVRLVAGLPSRTPSMISGQFRKYLSVQGIVRMNLKISAATFFLFACITTAQAQHYSLGVTTGTRGVGLEAVRTFGFNFAARAGYTGFSYSKTGIDGDEYLMDTDLKLSTANLFADWFPFGGVFHLTTGLMYNLTTAEAVLTPSDDHDVGGRIYTPGMLGSLTAEIEFNRAVPYLGIGYREGHAAGLGFTLDAGVYYHGRPRIDLSADGLLEPSTEQEPIIEDNLKWFTIYPVVTCGIMYTF